MYASHVAAMAPATNIGSSTPVSIGGGGTPVPLPGPFGDQGEKIPTRTAKPKEPNRTMALSTSPQTAMERKVVNDAVAYIQGLAHLRDRNVEWAEETVRMRVESDRAPTPWP